MKEIETKYNHKKVEEGKYEEWKKKGYFESGDKTKDPFCIVIPPPNVTGKLHLGHALDVSIQDIIIRYKRMQGFDCLWLPGMDHAAIATEAKVVKKLKELGIDKYEYGREKFLEACWDWTHEYSGNIRDQWAKVGISVDYNKERFTLDEGLNKAVTKVFVDYYNEGIIYKGERIINWDPAAQTALSNEEVIYKEIPGAFYHLKYIIEGTDDYLDVATTRPETLFGDTAVAVNPNDKRYNSLIGKKVILPIVNKLIPIIGDEHADPEFGTGVVKITPAHDPNDFEVGNRHNLERVIVMNPDGTMNSNALQYQGMSREMCRAELLKDLEREGLLLRIEPMTHSVGHSERTGVMVEPYLSKQWFVKMGDLAKKVLETQKKKDEKVNFVPERFEKILNHWMEISYDWCISRQLWWGHRIPAWYKDDEIYVGMEAPEGEGWIQDADVLDTWFSSALWPFSTLGWPEKTDDMERYYPNNVLVTAYDIIFFWVARMIFQAEHITGKRPFKDCIIHGLIRSKDGRKMSKSLGNGIDPMDMIDEYGADALRFYLTTDVAMGTDLRFDTDKVAGTWNFINKLWNASRFVLLNIDDLKKLDFNNLKREDKWILTKYEEIVKRTIKHMDKYEFNLVGAELYDFIWNDFCSSYIEFAKFNLGDQTTKSVLFYVLEGIIKMMHPFMPFVTEEIYHMLPIQDSESIMISTYPKYDKEMVFTKEKKEMDRIIEFISLFRNKKAENNIGSDFEIITDIDNELILKMLRIEDKIVISSNLPGSIEVLLDDYKIIICYDDSKQKGEELESLRKEKDNLEISIERRKKLLANENYVAKAPEKIVNQERDNLAHEEAQLKIILQRLEQLN
ncbi:MAG TPA: valine--tRNA ligase [Candidatus Coprovivens excrementavium]|nr:valine--tRNA ligase [Candidatus Coprovivens excrementavium]